MAAPLVCLTLEDRNVSQNLEVGLQGRRVEASHSRPTGEFNRCLLHSQLADFLDDDAEPGEFRHAGAGGLFHNRVPIARPSCSQSTSGLWRNKIALLFIS